MTISTVGLSIGVASGDVQFNLQSNKKRAELFNVRSFLFLRKIPSCSLKKWRDPSLLGATFAAKDHDLL